MGWKERLQAASFRGVTFNVEDDEGTFGRRVQTHEYPNRDKPWTEDLGRATRRFNISAYLVGDDYLDRRDALIKAIETPGPGTLVHPYYGEMSICIDGAMRITHTTNEGRMCRIAFSVVESGELSFPTSGAATGQNLVSSSSDLDDRIGEAFSSFGMDGMADFMQSGVIERATDMMEFVSDTFTMIDSGVSAAARLMKGDLSVLLMPPSSGMNFVNSLQKMWRAGKRLQGDASDLITMIKTVSGVSVGHDLAPRGVWKTDSVTVQRQATQSNYVAAAIRTTAISEAAYVVSTLPQPRASAAQGAGSAMITRPAPVSHPALNPGAVPSQPLVTWDDLVIIRESLNTAIETELERTQDDALFLALQTLKASLNSDISSRLAQVEKTAAITPKEVLPALVLAASWYDNAARESDITGRNAITHPGFVPVKPLRVPVL